MLLLAVVGMGKNSELLCLHSADREPLRGGCSYIQTLCQGVCARSVGFLLVNAIVSAAHIRGALCHNVSVVQRNQTQKAPSLKLPVM